VVFRGIKLGVVTEIKLEIDRQSEQVLIPVQVAFEPGRIRTAGNTEATTDETVFRQGMEKLVARGLRGNLQLGNLLTGQLLVDLTFYPEDIGKQQVNYDSKIPVFPTVPSQFDQLQTTVKEFLAELKKLPLDKIGRDLAGTLEGTNKLTNAPEWTGLLRTITTATQELQKLVKTFDQSITPLLKNSDQAVVALRGTLGDVDKVLTAIRNSLELVEPGAPVTVDLSNTLEELAAAARSIRVFADYLERNPNALIYGKTGPGAKPQ